MRRNIIECKFIISKIQSLVCDSRGRVCYIKEFDQVIDDIYGFRHLSKKLDDSYDTRDILMTLDKIGINQLVELFNSRQTTDMLADLVAICYRLRELRDGFRKATKKSGRRDKHDVKEAKYLTKLYNDSIRYLKKRLGVQDRKSMYRKKYAALTNVLDRDDWGFSDGFSSLLDDDIFDDDFDDDDRTELDDFRAQLNGGYPRRRRTNYYDDDLEDDDEVDFDMGDGHLYDRVEKLTDVVSKLSSSVQRLITKQNYDSATTRRFDLGNRMTVPRPGYPEMGVERTTKPTTAPSPSAPLDIQFQISQMEQREQVLMDQMSELQAGQQALNGFLQEIMSDVDDEDYDDDIGSFTQKDAMDRYNQMQDPHTLDSNERMSREQVIDMINQQQPSDNSVPSELAAAPPTSQQ